MRKKKIIRDGCEDEIRDKRGGETWERAWTIAKAEALLYHALTCEMEIDQDGAEQCGLLT